MASSTDAYHKLEAQDDEEAKEQLAPASPDSPPRPRFRTRDLQADVEEHHSRYTRLDAERAHFRAELCSWAAAGDTFCFCLCATAGYILDSIFYTLSGPDLNQRHERNIFDGIQYAWLTMSAAGVVLCFHRTNWFLLAFFVGSSACLLYRDLARGGRPCDNGSLNHAYWWSQAFALVLGPFVSWRIMLTSRALDRVYKVVRTRVDESGFLNYIRGAILQCVRGPVAPAPCIELEIHHEGKEGIKFSFYRDYDPGVDDPDDPETSEDEDARSQATNQVSSPKSKFCDEVALIYGNRGAFIEFQLTEQAHNVICVSKEEYAELEATHSSVLLFVYGRPERRRELSRYERVLLFADGSAPTRHLLCRIFSSLVVPALGLIIACIWFNSSAFRSNPVQYASIVLLMLPDLVHVFMHNGTDVMSNIIGLKEAGQNTTNRWEEAGTMLEEGWQCLLRETTLGSHVAVWDSSLFYCGCMFFIFLGCWQLHVAADSLRELTGLLHLHDHNSPSLQALLLHRLHRIRGRIVHKRSLRNIGAHAFPDRLRPDVSLGWWFETRACIFSDISRSVAKRVLILCLCLCAELVMIVLTCLAVKLDTGNDFEIMCYAAAYGVFLGLLIVLFVYLGSIVNFELDSGLQEIELENPEESPARSAPPGSPGRRTKLTRHRKPKDAPAVNELLDYARMHPLQLEFLGVPFTWQFATAYAAPVGTYAVGMIYWILQQTLVLRQAKGTA